MCQTSPRNCRGSSVSGKQPAAALCERQKFNRARALASTFIEYRSPMYTYLMCFLLNYTHTYTNTIDRARVSRPRRR